MSIKRLHILKHVTTCDSCGEYLAHCACTSASTICLSCGEGTADCVCDNGYSGHTLQIKYLVPAVQ